jgi:two-component system sensor histidine kinase/response regulator
MTGIGDPQVAVSCLSDILRVAREGRTAPHIEQTGGPTTATLSTDAKASGAPAQYGPRQAPEPLHPGSSFDVPARAGLATEASGAAARVPSACPDKVAGKLRVLVVEDEPADVELVLRALRQAGFDASGDVAQTAEEFTDLVRRNAYDVILADYKLPTWNGMESVEALRREGLDVPVIVVSGSLGELTAVECIKQGAADYVLKDHLTRLPVSVRWAIREKRLREEHKQAQEELARSNQDLEQFAYVASHDLQEPLRMVATYTQLLAERYRGQLDDNANKYIHYAVDGALRMQALVEDLLTFSRIGRQGTDLQSTDCNAVVETAVKNLRAAVDESKARVTHDSLPTVIADGSQLLQVFQNLIGNALKFRGSEQPAIHVSALKRGREWVFSVADNGIGIAPEFAEQIFVIFKRLHTRAEYPGSGIGLSICKKIVERQGGRIWVESPPGQGSTFKFTLPATKGRYVHSDENRG